MAKKNSRLTMLILVLFLVSPLFLMAQEVKERAGQAQGNQKSKPKIHVEKKVTKENTNCSCAGTCAVKCSSCPKKELPLFNPPGWGVGDKTGWEIGKLNPALKKFLEEKPAEWKNWSNKEQEEWLYEQHKGKEALSDIARKCEFKAPGDYDCATFSYEAATRHGVPIKISELLVSFMMMHQWSGLEIEQVTRALASGVEKKADFKKLFEFADSAFNDKNLNGKTLAIEIYKLITYSLAE
ncbi:MAG: hypothetical protein PHW04_10595 [Candidatus Wallbacteria bacterium]|nr:hypothetical protein [Candidatus Wallbacteria bacterium]